MRVGTEPHRPAQNVGLDQIIVAVDRLQRLPNAREILARIEIGVQLVHEAALQLAALPGQLLRIERDLLTAGRVGGHRNETRDPRRAAQLAAARPEPSDTASFLPGSDLLHLDTDTELLGENLDQFAEIDPFVGDIVENGLDLIALILHVADLHVEFHVGGDPARADHRIMFERDGLLPFLDIVGFGLAIDFLELAVLRVEAHPLHLAGDQIARQRDDPDIVAGRRLDGDDVAPPQRQVIHIAVIALARIFEADLENIGRKHLGHILQPIERVQLVATLAG